MSKVYQDIMSLIDVEIDAEEKAIIDEYIKKLNIWCGVMIILVLLAGGVAFYGISKENIWGFLAFLVPLFLMNRCNAFKQRQLNRIRFLINEKCDTHRALSAYVYLIGKRKRKKKWESHLYSTCLTLNYAGRTADSEKVMALFDKYCDNKIGAAHKKLLQISMAYQAQDAQNLSKYIEEMKALMEDKKVMLVMQVASQRAFQYPALLEAEQKGDYETLREMSDPNEEIDPRLKLVTDYYRLYKVAKAAGMNDLAEEHRAFILENGGDTYYKKELA